MVVMIGHANEYPIMHYFGIPRHTVNDSIIVRFSLGVSGNSSKKLHCGNVVNIPYWQVIVVEYVDG